MLDVEALRKAMKARLHIGAVIQIDGLPDDSPHLQALAADGFVMERRAGSFRTFRRRFPSAIARAD